MEIKYGGYILGYDELPIAIKSVVDDIKKIVLIKFQELSKLEKYKPLIDDHGLNSFIHNINTKEIHFYISKDSYEFQIIQFGRYEYGDDQQELSELYWGFINDLMNYTLNAYKTPDVSIKKECDYNGTLYELEISQKLHNELWNYAEKKYSSMNSNTTLYDRFVEYAIAHDKQNKFGAYTGDLSWLPKQLQDFYKSYNPIDVEVGMVKFIPVEHIRKVSDEYRGDMADGIIVIATQNGDPYFTIDGDMVYTAPHGSSLLKWEKLGTFLQFIQSLMGDGLMKESVESEYNTDMSEMEAKKTLRTLSQGLINDFSKDQNKKMTQYTANIYANVITKNLLPKWAKGFTKFRITLDSYQSFHTFEFIPPTMGQDFVSRFVNGRESLNGHLHRSPEIRVKMSPRIFHTMKSPDDAFNFFKAAIKYYDSQVEKSGNKLMGEVMKLGHNMKHLIGNSKLSGIVTYPLTLLFVFDDVDMANKNIFKISNDDIQSINKFVRNISSRYAAPEKEKKQIVEDVKKMVEALKESCEVTDTIRDIHYLPEAVEKFLFEGFNDVIMESSRVFIEGQVDRDWNPTPQVKYYKEAWGVKKLKKIPKDLIPYIQIETEAIKDANDKMILSSYTLGKIEIVEWYIELLTVGSKKYIVPHTKPFLEIIRTKLLECYKKIMNAPVQKADRPIIDIKYPKGYEG